MTASPAEDKRGAPKKRITEEWSAYAPVPGPRADLCRDGAKDLTKVTHPFKAPFNGHLDVEMTGFTGDWDLYILDAEGSELTGPSLNPLQIEEASLPLLKKGEQVSIVACNYSGGSEAELSLFFNATRRCEATLTCPPPDLSGRKKAKKVTRTQTYEYVVPSGYGFVGSVGLPPGDRCPIALGCVRIVPRFGERYVSIEIQDDSGNGAPFGIVLREDRFCSNSPPLEVTPGHNLEVYIDTFAYPDCQGPATSGTLIATFSNVP